jgi:myo-inositol 2-dehydrogenase/D-chiro-inositol 1-dehydrogenase
MMESGVVTLCLCGGGRIGTVHLRDLVNNPRVKLVAIVEVIESRRKEMVAAVGSSCKGYASFDEALSDRSNPFKGVLVCTPTGSHYEIVMKALNNGIAVFCEKPVSLDIKEIDECYNTAAKVKLPLLCAFQRRFDPNFTKLRHMVVNGRIGKVHIIRTTSRDHPVPSIDFLKISGGIFHDCGSHDIDMQRFILNEDPYEVYATASSFIPEIKALNDYDTVAMVLKYKSGVIGMIDLDRTSAYGYDQRIEVHGDNGMLQAENKHPTSVVLSNREGTHLDTINYTFTDRYPEAYRLELEHFIDLMTGKETVPRLTHQDVRRCALIADAAEKSARSGKPVQITYD